MTDNQTHRFLPVPTDAFQIPTLPPDISGKGQVKFSLVLPTYNESKNIPQIVAILAQLLHDILPGEYELIVVDDNSPDKTWQLAESLFPTYLQLKVMCRVQEKGLSTAVIRGWQAAEGEILGVIDADLQHPPEVLLQLWQKM